MNTITNIRNDLPDQIPEWLTVNLSGILFLPLTVNGRNNIPYTKKQEY
jgi:hypothetical protein